MYALFLFLVFVRLIWFVIFFAMAWRAHALTGANSFAAVMAGLGAAVLALAVPNSLIQLGLLDWKALNATEFYPECSYLILFPAVFALLRRLFKLRGFGRDFWLVTAMMAPLGWIMFWTVATVSMSFRYGPL